MNITTEIDYDSHRYPFCLIWTPIPLITWLVSEIIVNSSLNDNWRDAILKIYVSMIFMLISFHFQLPFVGHMGIATSQGIIRDFAGLYLNKTLNDEETKTQNILLYFRSLRCKQR